MSSPIVAETRDLASAFITEITDEAAVGRRCLERIPPDKFEYKPHPKSMSMGQLAVHLGDMFSWTPIVVGKNELDFTKWEYVPFVPATTDELVNYFDEHVANAIDALQGVTDAEMAENWQLRNGEVVLFSASKAAAMRWLLLNHIIHHRGQLSVYMRLLDIPVPAMYGPSADESGA